MGDPSTGTFTQIVISGFSTMSSGNTYTIEFPKIYNPSVGGDNVQVSIVVYALDLASGWPGTFLYYREAKNVYRIKTNVPVIQNAANLATAVSNDFTFLLAPLTTLAGDILVLELNSAASLGSSSPVCKDDSMTALICKYYSSSNTVIMTLLNPTTSIIIYSVVNPLPSALYLDFYLNYWTLNKFSDRLYYMATSQLPITVTYSDKTGLYINDMIEYQIQFMPTKIVPSTGSVVITFPAEFPSLPETTCYNLYSGYVSFMTGAYKCAVSGLSLTLTKFNNLLTGKNVVIRVLAQNPSSALTTATGIQVSTYSTLTAIPANLIETNTDSNTYTILNTVAPLYYDVPRQSLQSNFVTAGSYAPIKISISGFGSILANTGNLKITLNGFGTIPTNSELICL